MVQAEEIPTTRMTVLMEAPVLNGPNGRELIVPRRLWRNPLPSLEARNLIWSFLLILCSRRPAPTSTREVLTGC